MNEYLTIDGNLSAFCCDTMLTAMDEQGHVGINPFRAKLSSGVLCSVYLNVGINE